MEKIKSFLNLNTNSFITSGLVLIVLAAISSFLRMDRFAESLVIYAYFAFVFGVLNQMIELRFGVSFSSFLQKILRQKRELVLVFLLIVLWFKIFY